MKNSGIEWIGNIPDDWSVSRYKFYTTNRMGETILASDTKETGIPIYSATQEGKVFGYVDKANVILKSGDIVIPARGNSIGCAKIVEDEIATCTQTTICSCDIRNCENKYLVYCCYGLKDYWFKYDGSAIPQITVKQVDNNYLPLPDLRVQNIIVKTLDAKCGKIDELIANQQVQIEKLKEYKQSVITEAVTKGLDKSAPMKDSGIEWIGEIPAHWGIVLLSSLFVEHKHKNIGMQCNNLLSLSYGKIKRKDINGNDGLLPESFEGYNVIGEGDIVLRLTDLQNDQRSLRTGLCGEEGIVTSAYVTLRKRNENLNPKYMYYYLHSFDINKGFYAMGSGVRQGLNYEGIRKLEMLFPSIEEQRIIVEFLEVKCEKIDNLISLKEEKIEKLQEYKKSLIYEYVTGKKEVC